MSDPSSSEHIARFRNTVRRLVQRAAEHEDHLQALVRAAEADVHHADAALAQVRAGPHGGAAERAGLERVNRSRERADAARRACVSGREQHVTARRLLCQVEDEQAADQQRRLHGHAAAVLVVDDFEDTRELIALVLRNAGFVVRTAVNGLDALIAAYEMEPAVIVMDMNMPVLNGIEATRLIKSAEMTRDAKVIAYTASPSLSEPLLDRLFVTILRKPATPEAVVAAVHGAASR